MNAHVEVYGIVQGVGFRAWARELAKEMGLNGYVKNVEDYVEIEVEGNKKDVEEFIKHCEHGPIGANVRKMLYYYGKEKGYKGFEIKIDYGL